VQFGLRTFDNTYVGIWPPPKTGEKNCLIINNLAAHFLIVLKFGRLRCGIPKTEDFWKPAFVKSKIARGRCAKVSSVCRPSLAFQPLSFRNGAIHKI